MKRLHVFVVLAGVVLDCGEKKEAVININPVGSAQIEYDQDGIVKWSSVQSYSVNAYYTLIDTITSPAGFNLPISAVANEGDSIRISWTLNGQLIENAFQAKKWDQDKQKWLYASYMPVPTNPFVSSVPVKASIYYLKANKTINRDATIQFAQTKKSTDVLGVSFGMSRDQVKQIESERLGVQNDPVAGWYELSPTLAIIRKSTNLWETYYTFEDNKLKSVSESAGSSSFSDRLRELAIKYKLQEEIQFFPSGNMVKEYIWNNGKIKFTIGQRAFDPYGKKASITYEKL